MAFKVKAIAKGYYKDKYRNDGDVFWLYDPKHFSHNWMKSLDSKLNVELKKDPKYAHLFKDVQIFNPTKPLVIKPEPIESEELPPDVDDAEAELPEPTDDSHTSSEDDAI